MITNLRDNAIQAEEIIFISRERQRETYLSEIDFYDQKCTYSCIFKKKKSVETEENILQASIRPLSIFIIHSFIYSLGGKIAQV